MLKTIGDNPFAFIVALALHLLMAFVVTLNIVWESKPRLLAHSTPEKVNIVKAVIVDESKMRAEMEKLKKAERQKEAQRKKRERDAKSARQREEKRLEALKKKQQQEKRRVAAEKKKVAQEKKHQVEERRLADLEAKRQKALAEEKRQKALVEEKRQKALAELRAEEERLLQEQMAAEQARMEAERQQMIQGEVDRHMLLIQQRVANRWIKPSGWRPGLSCRVLVRLVPGAGGGQVVSVRLSRSCGQPLFDRSVETAVFNASPLPLPSDPEAAERFRDLEFIFKPEE